MKISIGRILTMDIRHLKVNNPVRHHLQYPFSRKIAFDSFTIEPKMATPHYRNKSLNREFLPFYFMSSSSLSFPNSSKLPFQLGFPCYFRQTDLRICWLSAHFSKHSCGLDISLRRKSYLWKLVRKEQ